MKPGIGPGAWRGFFIALGPSLVFWAVLGYFIYQLFFRG